MSLYFLCCSVNGYVCRCVLRVCELLGKQFAICLGVVVMEVLSVCGGALLDIPCMVFQRMCVLCL